MPTNKHLSQQVVPKTGDFITHQWLQLEYSVHDKQDVEGVQVMQAMQANNNDIM